MDAAALADNLKLAMRRMPGPVSLITTRDPGNAEPAGMIVSAVIPVSMAPPSMLVAVNRDSSCHSSIERAGRTKASGAIWTVFPIWPMPVPASSATCAPR